MHNLLSEGFYRLFRKKAFWVVMAVTAGYKLYSILNHWDNARWLRTLGADVIEPFDHLLYEFTFIAMLTGALLIPFFIGEDYSGGTLRNRLMAGHGRASVYLSNLAVVSGGMLFTVAADMALSCTLGVALLDKPLNSVGRMIFLWVVGLLTVLSCCSLYTMIAMVMGQKATATAVCLGLFALMLYIGGNLHTALYMKGSQFAYLAEYRPMSGVRRQIALFVYDLLPFTQAFDLSETPYELGNPVRMLFCSLGVMVASTAGGIFVFDRKNIR